ncbi:Beta-lactamase superfamily domain protein [uncultured archaeon]|nr:Beta-lactamase superfamily domain protein [uncultured archaeon]
MRYKNIDLKWGGHSGFLIQFNSMNIYIDPLKLTNSNNKADLILISHGHWDHCSVQDIKNIIKAETKIIGPSEVLSQTRQVKDGIDFEVAEPGKSFEFNGININCVDAYNVNKPFHSKGDSVGFILDFSGTTIYHAADTDIIPEMNSIRVDVALLPISGKFTMDFHEAARAASIINPDLAIPMHWGASIGTLTDAQNFVKLCKEKGISASILEKEI